MLHGGQGEPAQGARNLAAVVEEPVWLAKAPMFGGQGADVRSQGADAGGTQGGDAGGSQGGDAGGRQGGDAG